MWHLAHNKYNIDMCLIYSDDVGQYFAFPSDEVYLTVLQVILLTSLCFISFPCSRYTFNLPHTSFSSIGILF